MEINRHVAFRTDDYPDFIDYLKNNDIPHEIGEIISCLDIFESDPRWLFVSKYARENDFFCMSETIFSKEELLSAEWLRVRSAFRFGYPQPEGAFEYENITYSRKDYCKNCASGLVQVDSFRMKKAPKWGKRNFLELNWVGDELFISGIAKKILEEAQITGIDFCGVKNKPGTEFFDDIHQLLVPDLLDYGMIEERSPIRGFEVCPYCNVKKYVPSGRGMFVYRKDCFENAPDVVKTSECFGSGHYISRMIFVRQKVYRIITENKLDRALVFEPILLQKQSD